MKLKLTEEDVDNRDFLPERVFIASLLHINVGRVYVCGNHPVMEDVIFIDGVYQGYLDQRFYDYMIHGIDEYDEIAEWVEGWRNK